MSLLFGIGASMVVGSVLSAPFCTPNAETRRTLGRYLRSVGLENVKIHRVRSSGIEVLLPLGVGLHKFREKMEGLEMALDTTIRIKHLAGRLCLIKTARPLKVNIQYDDLMETGQLAIPLHSPFGTVYLDFTDETCVHLLVGGATRMGKTVLLRLIATHILKQTKGNVEIVFIDNKITDLVMFKDIPQIKIAETAAEAKLCAADVIAESIRRKEIIKKSGEVDGRKLPPMFLIIDEYGRFADDDDFQKQIIEIAETAGYLNIHLVIATQRPDATSAIKPRIKANLVTRLAFTTADESNSQIILGVGDAAHLGKIQGRAILLDGFPETVQVPFLSVEHAKEVVKPYVRERQIDNESPATIPSFVTDTLGASYMPDSSPTKRNYKPRSKKVST